MDYIPRANAFADYIVRVMHRLGPDGDTARTPERENSLAIMGAMRLGHLATRESDIHVMRQHGTTFAQFRVLFGISVIGPMTPADIATTFDITRATTTKLVNALERDGLVLRSPHPEDGRSKLLEITQRGRKLVAKAQADQDRFQDAFLHNLSRKERKQLGALLVKALTNVE